MSRSDSRTGGTLIKPILFIIGLIASLTLLANGLTLEDSGHAAGVGNHTLDVENANLTFSNGSLNNTTGIVSFENGISYSIVHCNNTQMWEVSKHL